jgi:D-glycero-D-manno-heptose 1,7-bisphosphate phosphatase
VQRGFFLDIGVPASYTAAAELIAQNRPRPALFLDRDGVLNVDRGYVHLIEDFEWTAGAIEAVKCANDRNRFVFLVTNQAGVARGYYSEEQVGLLHEHLQRELRRHGAHIDDVRYCPFHPDGTVVKYAKASRWRKPEPGMFLDLLESWPVDRGRSVAVGDKASDLEAARRADLAGVLFAGGNLAVRLAEIDGIDEQALNPGPQQG